MTGSLRFVGSAYVTEVLHVSETLLSGMMFCYMAAQGPSGGLLIAGHSLCGLDADSGAS